MDIRTTANRQGGITVAEATKLNRLRPRPPGVDERFGIKSRAGTIGVSRPSSRWQRRSLCDRDGRHRLSSIQCLTSWPWMSGRGCRSFPQTVAVKDVRLQEAVLRDGYSLRMIVTDAVAQRRLVDESTHRRDRTRRPPQHDGILLENSPFDLLKKQTVDASVESIVQQSPKTYEVTWPK